MHKFFRGKAGLIILGVAFAGLSACNKPKQQDAPESDAPEAKVEQKSPESSPLTSSLKPANPTSFDEVAAQLDPGGSFYFYLSTEELTKALSTKILEFRDTVVAAIPDVTPEQRTQIEKTAKIVTDLVKESGIEDFTGAGASSIEVEQGLYQNKVFLHHPEGQGDGFLWKIAGGEPHPLTSLELLPKDTAIASFSDIDLAGLLKFIRHIAEKSGSPEAVEGINQASAMVQMSTGMTLEELLASTGKEWGILLTLDPEKTVTVPVDEQPQTFPSPRVALLLRVNDDQIFQRVSQMAGGNPQIESVNEDGLQMHTMPLPMPPVEELGLRPTVAQWNNWLIVSSHDTLVRDVIAAKDGGFADTEEFKRVSAGLPTEGNSFSVATRAFSEAVMQFQRASIAAEESITPEQNKLMEMLLNWQKPAESYSVSTRVENGVLSVNKGSNGPTQLLAPIVVVPVAFAAGFSLPVFDAVQTKGKANQSLSNAKQIAVACILYANDNKGAFPPELKALVPSYIPDGTVLISPFNPAEVGYSYTAGLTTDAPAETPLIEDKYSEDEGFKIIVHVDASGKIEKIK